MASAIVPVDDFTATIYGPDAGDSRADAAEVVTAIAQIMGDRTLHLKNLDDLKAILADANVFTAAPQSVDNTPASIALWESPRIATDDTTFPAHNRWKLILNYKADASRWVRLYTGTDDALGHMAITVNAFWHQSDGKWRPDTQTKDSFGMFALNEALVVSRQTAGPFDWTTWPANAGDIIAGNAVTATTINAVANVNVFADCNVAGNVVVAGEVTYPLGGPTPSFKQRTKIIPLVDVLADSGAAPFVNGNGDIETQAGGGVHSWPIVLPRGAQLVKVEWLVGQSSASGCSVDVQRRAAANYGSHSVPAFGSIGGGVSGPASSGVQLVANTAGLPITISEAEEYRAVWIPAVPGAGNDNVQQIRITFNDPGARSN